MAGFRKMKRTRGMCLVLWALAREEPLNMSGLKRETGLAQDVAKEIRDQLAERGLLEICAVTPRGPVEVLEIRLTPLGREAARHVAELARILESTEARADASSQSSG